jgi:hypothetical protein
LSKGAHHRPLVLGNKQIQVKSVFPHSVRFEFKRSNQFESSYPNRSILDKIDEMEIYRECASLPVVPGTFVCHAISITKCYHVAQHFWHLSSVS